MIRPLSPGFIRRCLTGSWALAGIVISSLAAVLAGLFLLFVSTEVGVGFVGVCCLVVALAVLPTGVRVGAPFALLIFVPFDHLMTTTGEWLGWPVLVMALALVIGCTLRWRSFVVVQRDWDIHLLLLAKLASVLAHLGAGQVRMMLFWLAAGALVIWIRTEERVIQSVRNQILLAVMLVGAAQGVVAIIEGLQLVDLPGLVPGYEPNASELRGTFGIRSVGLGGDPLRLGTLTMLSALISLSRMTAPDHPHLKRGFYAWVLCFSFAGLILSGARGSWLGFVAGGCAMVAALLTKAKIQRIGWALAAMVALVALIGATDLGVRIGERLWGSSVHPMSVEQRIEAMHAVALVWREAPVLGVGPGGMASAMYSAGMRVANVENEYLIALLGGGAICLLALCIVVARRSVLSWRYRNSSLGSEILGSVVALSVNLSTYNLLSWSAGAAIFVAVSLLATPSPEWSSSAESS